MRIDFERLECRKMLTVDVAVELELPAPSSEGQAVSYEVRLANLGDGTASSVVVSDRSSDAIDELKWSRVPLFTSESEIVDLTNEASRGIVIPAGFGFGVGGDLTEAGDVNGDGIEDIAFGAGGATVDGVEVGAIYVVFGSNDELSTTTEPLDETTWPGESFFDVNSLDGTNGFTIHGWDRGGTRVVFSSNTAGDVNGDGLDDLLVLDGEGNVYLVFGRSRFEPVVELLDANVNGLGARITGDLPDGFGIGSAVAAGDVNGDEIDDILLGGKSLFEDTSYVIYGRKAEFETEILLSDLDASEGFRIDGAIGHSGGGDVNGDHIDDLIFRSDRSTDVVFVLYGSADGFEDPISLLDIDGQNGFQFFPPGPNLVDIVGDLNADGVDDFVLPLDNSDRYAVVFGSTDFTDEFHLATMDSGEGFFINFPDRGAGGVDGLGDVNGDGIADLVIGRDSEIIHEIPDPNGGQPQAEGRVYVLFGSTDYPFQIDATELNGVDGFKINGDPKRRESGFGVAVANGADANGDGVQDILIGAPSVTGGRAYIVYGRRSYGGTGPLIDVVNLVPDETVSYLIQGRVKERAPNGPSPGRVTATVNDEQNDVEETNNTIDYAVTVSESLPGDVNGDGAVAFDDFLILSANFGIDIVATREDGDLNGDQAVDFADFLILSVNFRQELGPSPPTQTVIDTAFAG